MRQEKIQYLPLDKLAREQLVRLKLNDALVEQIAQSFKSVGQLQPVCVRWADDRFSVFDGHHRVAAAEALGWKDIACIAEEKSLCEGEVIERQLIANCLRESLTPLETARGIRCLMTETAWSASEAAEHLGFSNAKVSKLLALFSLPAAIAEQVEAGKIPPSAAYELAQIDNPDHQATLAQRMADGQLTRDGVVGVRKSRRGNGDVPVDAPTRVTAPLGGGRSVTISGPALSMDSLISWLEELLGKARKARPQGLELRTFIRTLKDISFHSH